MVTSITLLAISLQLLAFYYQESPFTSICHYELIKSPVPSTVLSIQKSLQKGDSICEHLIILNTIIIIRIVQNFYCPYSSYTQKICLCFFHSRNCFLFVLGATWGGTRAPPGQVVVLRTAWCQDETPTFCTRSVKFSPLISSWPLKYFLQKGITYFELVVLVMQPFLSGQFNLISKASVTHCGQRQWCWLSTSKAGSTSLVRFCGEQVYFLFSLKLPVFLDFD